MIVGGYALAAHGLPRATGDLDAWVWVDPANAQRIVAALRDFGFGQMEILESDFTRSDSVVQLGYPPYRVDILTSIDGWTSKRHGIGDSLSRFKGCRCQSSGVPTSSSTNGLRVVVKISLMSNA